MTDLIASPRLQARVAGLLYLVVIAAGVFTVYVGSALIVRGDAAATTHNLAVSERLFRLGVAADLLTTICYLAVTALLYELLKPANRSLSLIAAFFSLAGLAVSAASAVHNLAPFAWLGGASYLGSFTPGQLQALAYGAIRIHGQGYSIATVFFGLYCLSLGALVLRSTFLPKLIGLLLLAAGTGWLVDGILVILAPAVASQYAMLFLAPGILGEGSLTLWLLAAGVDEAKWKAQARVEQA